MLLSPSIPITICGYIPPGCKDVRCNFSTTRRYRDSNPSNYYKFTKGFFIVKARTQAQDFPKETMAEKARRVKLHTI